MLLLTEVDLDQTVTRAEYRRVFPDLQERVRALQYELLSAEIPTVVVFEGWDAAGKGTVIGRLTERLDPRAFRVHPGSPPSALEERYHFLWRYQMKLPEDGHMAVFDHSWYGRVLVERVEKLARKREWQPAYAQINELERWLADDGQVVVKFFLHISRKEQRRRLRAMEKDPAQRWKVEKEDWRRNRRYDRWRKVVDEMLERTHTAACPWTVVAATDPRWTRLAVFRTLVERMEGALARRQNAPGAVSRTHLAEETQAGERARRAAEELDLVRNVARDAGMPLEGPQK